MSQSKQGRAALRFACWPSPKAFSAKIFTFSRQIAPQATEAQGPRDAMEMMRESFRRFLADQGGATAVEYCVICACIFLVIIAAMVNFGSAAGNMFNNLSNAVAGTP